MSSLRLLILLRSSSKQTTDDWDARLPPPYHPQHSRATMSLAVPRPSSVCGSSSPMTSSCDSFFSKESWSTGASSSRPNLEPLAYHHHPPPPVDAQTKASSIRLPLHLPAPPEVFDEVDLSSLIVDDELEGAPVGFAVGKLRSVGSSSFPPFPLHCFSSSSLPLSPVAGSTLLNATTSTSLHVPPGPLLPAYLRVTLPSLPFSGDASPVFLPSHVFAVRSADSPRTLLLPAHGLLWAATSPALSILSCRPEKQPAHPSLPDSSRPADEGESTHFPVVELNLPSSSTFPCLQGWVYLRSPALLLSSLLPTPVPSAPSPPTSLSHLLNPAPKPAPSLLTPETLTETLSSVSSQTLLAAIHRVHGLWGNVVALQIGDEDLWKVMGLAWKILVAALALRERERRSRSVTLAESGSSDMEE